MGLDAALSETMKDVLMPQFEALLSEMQVMKEAIDSLRQEIDFIRHPDRIIKKKEAAELLGVCSREIERMVARGDLPQMKLNGNKNSPALFYRMDVLRLLKVPEPNRDITQRR
ncbi:helix-turn-helix transcriptional regulator [Dethiosulfovibrio salsuginis]|uniref:DNA binding domain-containing protein, excisionase family n=1 Tax=Dethiosulfovibrio salsuginis TaxID=561720 RepID=A0A1X7KHP5_9BACT|nr:helix-turn-helix domain-containing protein [Dethiosulfovibrio salsuginis]SMG40846.1 DNA binding domain-containing protein, excisionase family [Dethiosulfovibrio salsuginis]